MNTLITDLCLLIDKHLTVIEDNFLNKKFNQKTKNIKHAVRDGDWKSTLYYLQRYEYQQSIIWQAYYGACQRGDECLINLFLFFCDEAKNVRRSNVRLAQGLAYLAKYKHYQLFNKLKSDDAYEEFSIMFGLIAANDLDAIKKYIDFTECAAGSTVSGYIVGKCIQTLFKINNPDMIEYVRSIRPHLFEGAYHQRYIILGKASGLQPLTYDEVKSVFGSGICRSDVHWLTKFGYYDIVEKFVLDENISSNELKSSYVVGLLTKNKSDLVDSFLNKIMDDEDRSIIMILVAAEMDDVDLFKKYYSERFSRLTNKIVDIITTKASFKICKYLADENIIGDTFGTINSFEDPKFARLILTSFKAVRVSIFLPMNCNANGYNIVAKLFGDLKKIVQN